MALTGQRLTHRKQEMHRLLSMETQSSPMAPMGHWSRHRPQRVQFSRVEGTKLPPLPPSR